MVMWPNGARAAAAFTFDFDAEAVWIGEDPANAEKPGVLSQGSYGARVAVPRILEILNAHGARATFSVPGAVAEQHPDRVKEIVEAGHELAHHGFTHTSPTRDHAPLIVDFDIRPIAPRMEARARKDDD